MANKMLFLNINEVPADVADATPPLDYFFTGLITITDRPSSQNNKRYIVKWDKNEFPRNVVMEMKTFVCTTILKNDSSFSYTKIARLRYAEQNLFGPPKHLMPDVNGTAKQSSNQMAVTKMKKTKASLKTVKDAIANVSPSIPLGGSINSRNLLGCHVLILHIQNFVKDCLVLILIKIILFFCLTLFGRSCVTRMVLNSSCSETSEET